MSEHVYTLETDAPLKIGATGMDAITQNIRIILLTMAYSVPLDRSFAHMGRLIDSPAPKQTARLASELVDAIEKYEPRVEVRKIEFVYHDGKEQLMQGWIAPKVIFKIRDGVKL